MNALLAPMQAYAAAGLLVSLAAHVAALLGRPPGGEGLFFALHAGIFPLWLVVVLVANRLVGRDGWRMNGFWTVAMAGCPAWMKLMTKGFFAYALINFALFVVLAPHGKTPAGAPPASVWRGFSGHWMLFYSAGLAILTSARNIGLDKLPRKCANGHEVGVTDAYCPTCGARLMRPPGAGLL